MDTRRTFFASALAAAAFASAGIALAAAPAPPAETPSDSAPAQPADPGAPPPPPPVSTAGPASTAGQGAAPGQAPAPPVMDAVRWTPQEAPPGAAAATPEPPPRRLRWRGSSFEWYQGANTQYFGVGDSYISAVDQAYTMLFRFQPSFFLIDEPLDQLALSARIWASVELTNSNTTRYYREVEWRDTALSLRYTRTLFASPAGKGAAPDWLTRVGLGAGAAFPTSKVSLSQGRYLALNIGPVAVQQFNLRGSEADLLPSVTLTGTATYSHVFARSNVPTNPDLHVQRQNFKGDPIDSDVISGVALTRDHLQLGITGTLPVYKGLSLVVSYTHWMRFKPDLVSTAPGGCDVEITTGCVQAERLDHPVTFFVDTVFDASVTQNFMNVMDFTIGYNNYHVGSLAENGKRRNPLYSPDATFYLDLTFYLDQVYITASGAGAKNPSPLRRGLLP